MTLSSQDIEFLSNHNSAAMITTGNDGRPKVARVGVALIDGKLWSSGTEGRTRTRRLRRDPRCTVFVFDTGWNWLTLDTTVRILDGPDAPELNMRLFRTMQNRPTGSLNWFGREYEPEEFLQVLVDEQRIIYEFEVERAYGMR